MTDTSGPAMPDQARRIRETLKGQRAVMRRALLLSAHDDLAGWLPTLEIYSELLDLMHSDGQSPGLMAALSRHIDEDVEVCLIFFSVWAARTVSARRKDIIDNTVDYGHPRAALPFVIGMIDSLTEEERDDVMAVIVSSTDREDLAVIVHIGAAMLHSMGLTRDHLAAWARIIKLHHQVE